MRISCWGFQSAARTATDGVLLRDTPLNWSRFSHPAKIGDRTGGLYISLSGSDAGALSLVTLDAHGRVIDRKPLPKPTTQHGAGQFRSS